MGGMLSRVATRPRTLGRHDALTIALFLIRPHAEKFLFRSKIIDGKISSLNSATIHPTLLR